MRWFLEGTEVSAEYLADNEIQLTNVAQIKNWQPDAVFVPGNVVPRFIPGIKIGVFHGFNAGKINRRGREDHFEIRGCFDLYCTQGPDTTVKFQELARQYGFFDVVQTGWPALDPLFSPTLNNPYIDTEDQRKTVLLCSTFSRNLTCAPHIFNQVKQLADTGKWRWLVQFHPKMAKETVDLYKSIQGPNLRFIETDNVLPLLQAADVMLCDTSSILLMFLLQQKPVVTFKNQSPNDWLLNITQPEDIEQALEYALTRPTSLMEAIANYSEQIHPYHDGLSSQRVLAATNQLITSGRQHLKPKPLNFIREFKMRKKLHHWTW